jgi:hypothetical protein
MDRSVAIRHHLGYNHYPPITSDFDESAEQAIDAVNAGDYDQVLTLPNGVELTAGTIVEDLHLDGFLDVDEYFFE